jgi:hypothetical protein
VKKAMLFSILQALDAVMGSLAAKQGICKKYRGRKFEAFTGSQKNL